jgi:hypothetical protein
MVPAELMQVPQKVQLSIVLPKPTFLLLLRV